MSLSIDYTVWSKLPGFRERWTLDSKHKTEAAANERYDELRREGWIAAIEEVRTGKGVSNDNIA